MEFFVTYPAGGGSWQVPEALETQGEVAVCCGQVQEPIQKPAPKRKSRAKQTVHIHATF